MLLQRRDPFADYRRVNYLANRFWRRQGVGEEISAWAVPLDVVKQDDEVAIHASLPGVKPEDVEVTIEDGVLKINVEGKSESEEQNGNYVIRERRTGKFHRTLRLPDSLDADKAETRYADGVLTITFPKVEAQKAKRLEITAG